MNAKSRNAVLGQRSCIPDLVEAGTFRQDLFYRLNVFPIKVPPLRERIDDIPLLVEYLIERYARNAGKTINSISKKTMDLFQRYEWPGNVRELQNVIERAVVLSNDDTFRVDESWFRQNNTSSHPAPSLEKRPRELRFPLVEGLGRVDAHRQKELIEAALAKCGGRVAGPHGASAMLGVPRQTLGFQNFQPWDCQRSL